MAIKEGTYRVEKIDMESREYPELLKEIKDPPKSLYFIGNIGLLSTKCIAMVGSRSCTSYGTAVAGSIGGMLAESGVTVVSGLAKGIDHASQEGAMKAGGSVVAVLAGGPDVCYPKTSRMLYSEIAEKGLVISEYEPGELPKPYTFPARNRIISGVSLGVVAIEAGIRSGAIITCEHAADQGREIYAVPGNITSPNSFGTNKLIAEGVRPLVVPGDILRDLGVERVHREKKELKLGRDEKLVYELVTDRGEVSIDDIIAITDLAPARISGILTVLEMKRLIKTGMGKAYIDKLDI